MFNSPFLINEELSVTLQSLGLASLIVKVARALLTSVGSLKIKLNKTTDGHLLTIMPHTQQMFK